MTVENGNLNGRLEKLKKDIEKHNNLEDILECVAIYVSKANFADAELILRTYLNKEPDDEDAKIVLAKLLWESKRGSRKEIIKLLNSVLIKNHENEEAKEILNEIFNTFSDNDELDQLKEKPKDYLNELLSSAERFQNDGRLKDALTIYQEILEKVPECEEAQTGFRETYAMIVSEKSKKNIKSGVTSNAQNLMKIKYQINTLQVLQKAARKMIKTI